MNHWKGYLFDGITPGTDGSIAADVVAQAEAITAQAAMEKAKLGWGVEKIPAVGVIDGEPQDVPGKFFIVRTDTRRIIGTVGNHYQTFVNGEAFAFADALIAAARERGVGMGWLGAGESQGGAKVSGLLSVGNPIGVGSDPTEAIVPMLLLETAHDGTKKLKAKFVAPRWACMNGMWVLTPVLLDSYEVKHTLYNRLQVEEANTVLTQGLDHFGIVGDLVNTLAGVKLNKRQGVKLIKAIYPAPKDNTRVKAATIAERVQQEILAKWQGSPSLGNLRNTAYGLWQAAVEYDDYDGRTRKVGDRSLDELRFERAVSGTPLKTRALAVIREYAQAA